MSVVVPEPPPPPPPQRPPAFDFIRPFAFVFEDPRWVPKILMGGVFVIACVVLIGIFFIYGYLARVIRNAANGVEPVLPEWDDLGEFFSEGLRLFAVNLVYAIPLGLLFGIIVIPIAMVSMAGNSDSEAVSNGLASCISCLMFPISLAFAIWMPAALLMTVMTRDFGAAFQFSRIAQFIKANIANYVIALLVALIAQFAGEIAGFMTLCTCMVFTLFWAMLVAANALAQVYRLSPVR